MGAGQVGGDKLVGAGQVRGEKLVGASHIGSDITEGEEHQVEGDKREGANQLGGEYNMMVEGFKIKTPKFASEFCIYTEEVNMWNRVCGLLKKEEQGIVLWLELPRDDPSNIKELIMEEIGA